MKKKLLSIALTLAMLLSVVLALPISASAKELPMITDISFSLTEITHDNLASLSCPKATLTSITEGNEDLELETGYIYFYDKDGKWIYVCYFSGPEASPTWYGMSNYEGDSEIGGMEELKTAPDYSKIKTAVVNVRAVSEENGFAPELTVMVNGKPLSKGNTTDESLFSAESIIGYQSIEVEAYFYVPFDVEAPQEAPASPKTGDTTDMALWLIVVAAAFVTAGSCSVICKKKFN